MLTLCVLGGNSASSAVKSFNRRGRREFPEFAEKTN